MSRHPYAECPACTSCAVTRSATLDTCRRCGHSAREFICAPSDPLAHDGRPKILLGGGAAWLRPARRPRRHG